MGATDQVCGHKAAVDTFQQVYDGMPLGVCRLTRNFEWLAANIRMAAILGYDSSMELVGQGYGFRDFFVNSREWEAFARQAREAGPATPLETRIYKQDRQTIWGELSVQVFRDADGDFLFYEVYLQDITRQKHRQVVAGMLTGISHAVSTTKDLDHLYRAIHDLLITHVDTPNFFIAIVDEIGDRLVFPYYEDEEDEMGDIVNISDPETRSLTLDVIRSGEPLLLTREQIVSSERVAIGPVSAVWVGIPLTVKGTTIGAMAIQHYSNPHHFPTDAINIMTSVSEQVALAIERKMTEDALKESEAKYRNILESIDDGYFEADLEGNFTFFNESLGRLLGYTAQDMMGMNFRNFMDNDNARELISALKPVIDNGAGTKTLEGRLTKQNGSFCFVEAVVSLMQDSDGQKVGFRGIARDVTERLRAEEENRKLQAQLLQTQKMEGIGTLAGGIAHDFNNILGIILGNTELALDDLGKDTPVGNNLSEVRSACLRARDMVKHILAFSRHSQVERKPLNISIVVKEALKLLRSSLPASIVMESAIEEDSRAVLADATQINQVMINLCTNAAHAMAEHGGTLRVQLRDIELGQAVGDHPPDLTPGGYVQLTVADTGCGMSPEVRKRIFDPYFTTKKVNEGTGMGLSVVHGIVKEHSGAIAVVSESGRGSTFSIYFPVVKKAVEPETPPPPLFPTGTERVLFIDDEESLAILAENLLTRLGYRVQTQTRPRDALELFTRTPDRYDLVITDMTMPQMTGEILVAELRRIRTDIPIIISTGYSEKMDEARADQLGVNALIMKPLRIGELAHTIRMVLDEHG